MDASRLRSGLEELQKQRRDEARRRAERADDEAGERGEGAMSEEQRLRIEALIARRVAQAEGRGCAPPRPAGAVEAEAAGRPERRDDALGEKDRAAAHRLLFLD